MDPRIKLILQKAVDMEPTEKMTTAIDNLYVKMTVIPIQRYFRLRQDPYYYRHYVLQNCPYCQMDYSSSDDDDE